MTVVIGIDYLDELLIIADTRISKDSGGYYRDRGLKKLTVFGNEDKVVVLGFSGKVYVAKAVLSHIKQNRLTNEYRRRFAIPTLRDNIAKWIKEATENLNLEHVRETSFLLCALEPLRKRQIIGGSSQEFTPFPERHIYEYESTESRQVWAKEVGPIAVIGSGNDIRREIIKNAKNFINFGRGPRKFSAMRAVALSNVISMVFNNIGPESVGGPFEVVSLAIPPKPTQRFYQWSITGQENIEQLEEGNQTVLKNRDSGETHRLLPLLEWPC